MSRDFRKHVGADCLNQDNPLKSPLSGAHRLSSDAQKLEIIQNRSETQRIITPTAFGLLGFAISILDEQVIERPHLPVLGWKPTQKWKTQ